MAQALQDPPVSVREKGDRIVIVFTVANVKQGSVKVDHESHGGDGESLVIRFGAVSPTRSYEKRLYLPHAVVPGKIVNDIQAKTMTVQLVKVDADAAWGTAWLKAKAKGKAKKGAKGAPASPSMAPSSPHLTPSPLPAGVDADGGDGDAGAAAPADTGGDVEVADAAAAPPPSPPPASPPPEPHADAEAQSLQEPAEEEEEEEPPQPVAAPAAKASSKAPPKPKAPAPQVPEASSKAPLKAKAPAPGPPRPEAPVEAEAKTDEARDEADAEAAASASGKASKSKSRRSRAKKGAAAADEVEAPSSEAAPAKAAAKPAAKAAAPAAPAPSPAPSPSKVRAASPKAASAKERAAAPKASGASTKASASQKAVASDAKPREGLPVLPPRDPKVQELITQAQARFSTDRKQATDLLRLAARKGYLPAYMLLGQLAAVANDEELVIEALCALLSKEEASQQLLGDLLQQCAMQLAATLRDPRHEATIRKHAVELEKIRKLWPIVGAVQLPVDSPTPSRSSRSPADAGPTKAGSCDAATGAWRLSAGEWRMEEHVPGLSSLAEGRLEVSMDRILLYDSAGRTLVNEPMPPGVDGSKARAKWSQRTKTLTVLAAAPASPKSSTSPSAAKSTTGNLDGSWQSEDGDAIGSVAGSTVTWAGGGSSSFRTLDGGEVVLDDGPASVRARLDSRGRLVWTDGDVWVRSAVVAGVGRPGAPAAARSDAGGPQQSARAGGAVGAADTTAKASGAAPARAVAAAAAPTTSLPGPVGIDEMD